MGCGASSSKDTGSPVPPSRNAARVSGTGSLQSTEAGKLAAAECPSPMTAPVAKAKTSEKAVSLEWLQAFAATLPAGNMTTDEVLEQVLVPAICAWSSTAAAGGSSNPPSANATPYDSYAEYLLANSRAAVSMGRPYHYVIHARSWPFQEVVAMLRKHFIAEAQQAHRQEHRARHDDGDGALPEAFLWWDVFAASQSSSSSVSSTCSASGGVDDASGGVGDDTKRRLTAAVREAVAAAESVLLVLDDEGTALSQLWCLYGIWLAGALSRPLRVLTYDLDFENVRHMIAAMDIATAAAVDGTATTGIRTHVLRELLGAAADDEPLDASPAVGAASRALRDAVVASILAEAKEDQWRQESSTIPAMMASAPPDAVGTVDDREEAVLSAASIFRLDRAARMLEVLGRMAEAEVLFRRVLAATETALGTEHPDTLTSAANLASLLHDHGKLAEAEPLLRRVLSAHERALGATHHETAASLEALGMLLEQQGRLAEAEDAFRRALVAYEAALGPDCRDTLAAVNNLAAVLRLDGQLGEAEALYRRALDGYETVLGPAHHDTLGAVNNLALVLKAAGKLEAAEGLYRRALEGCEQGKGPDHPDTLSAVNNLAAALQARGDLASAEPLFRRALRGRELALGPTHPDTLGSVNNLAVLLQAHGQYSEAEPLFRRALVGWESTLPPDHTDTLKACWNLGVVLEALGRPGEALEMYGREAAARTRRGEAARAEQRQEHILRVQAQLGGGD